VRQIKEASEVAFLIILGVFLWIMVALWPAFIAKNKGYSFILFWILGWFISWILTLILVLLLPNRNRPALYAAPSSDTASDSADDGTAETADPLNR
jgi:RsiW-degrading membrane proteinase PrsW (M82 family)